MIALLTDFGHQDTYVGEMKAVLASAGIMETVDLCHTVAPGNIQHGQFLLSTSFDVFPEKTVFLAVVDPGVGTSRKPVAVHYKTFWFVGPDNGLFSFAASGQVFHINSEDSVFKPCLSETFHGRDIFAPAAAEIHRGNTGFLFAVRGLDLLTPIHFVEKTAEGPGEVLHVDHFGNIVTSIRSSLFGRISVRTGNETIASFSRTFGDGPDGLFIIPGSKGLLEIVARNQRASDLLKINLMDTVEVELL